MKKLLFYLFLACSLFPFILTPYATGDSKENTNDMVLTVQGALTSGKIMEFTLDDLMQLPQTSFKVTSRRSRRQDLYQGVALADLLKHIAPKGEVTVVEVVAINDYRAYIKFEDILRYGYLLSYKKNGLFYWEHELAENKGPLAIAINFDKHPQMDWEIYKHQLVWFVKEMNIE